MGLRLNGATLYRRSVVDGPLPIVRAVPASHAFSRPGFIASSRIYAAACVHRELQARQASNTRRIHSSNRVSRPSNQLLLETQRGDTETAQRPQHEEPRTPPLAVLPLKNVIRSLAITTISASPVLLPPALAIMSVLANSTNALLNPDGNPLLKAILKKTFYAQYCAGENAQEVRRTVDRLKGIGFSGVILGYAREVVLTEKQTRDLAACAEGQAAEDCVRNEVIPWATGTMETVRLAQPGDFVAIKFTGAGRQALLTLQQRLPPPAAIAEAIDSICALAASRGVRLLFDAEQVALQPGIDAWTLDYMRKYNVNTPDSNAIIYGTYQAYLLSTPATLSNHLAAARKEGFTLGVKLVRGAYLGSDPRHMMHAEKAGTDAAYDGIARALLARQWTSPLSDPEASSASDGAFPAVSLVLASHNADSVRKAREIRAKQVQDGVSGRLTELSYAQLQGMADEVSCALIADMRGSGPVEARPKAYKYLVWGTTGECMKYLLRRAQENRDALQRTVSGRNAMRGELLRRVKALFGF